MLVRRLIVKCSIFTARRGYSSFKSDHPSFEKIVNECSKVIDHGITSKQTFNQIRQDLEYVAEKDHVQAQFLLGVLLSSDLTLAPTTQQSIEPSSSSSSNKAEVMKEIRGIQMSVIKGQRAKKHSSDSSTITITQSSSTDTITNDLEAAKYWLKRAITFKHGRSMCLLANILLKSDSTDDHREAKRLYEEATRCSDDSRVDAYFNLGSIYYSGNENVPRDENKSFQYFLTAANTPLSTPSPSSSSSPQLITSTSSNSNSSSSLVDSVPSSEPTYDPDSCYYVGHCYTIGENGCGEINPKLALHYLHRDGNHPKALYLLATLYRSGLQYSRTDPSPTSEADASQIMPITINQSGPISTDNMSSSSSGAGVDNRIEPNHELFKRCLLQAVALDAEDALFCLADIKWNGFEGHNSDLTGTHPDVDPIFQVNRKEAITYYQRASDQGSLEATLCLAAIYYHGYEGIPRDPHQAFILYNIAAEKGSEDAWRNLAAMYYLGDGVEQSEHTAREIMKVVFGAKAE